PLAGADPAAGGRLRREPGPRAPPRRAAGRVPRPPGPDGGLTARALPEPALPDPLGRRLPLGPAPGPGDDGRALAGGRRARAGRRGPRPGPGRRSAGGGGAPTTAGPASRPRDPRVTAEGIRRRGPAPDAAHRRLEGAPRRVAAAASVV